MTIIFDDTVKQYGVSVLQIYTDISNIAIDVHPVCQLLHSAGSGETRSFCPPKYKYRSRLISARFLAGSMTRMRHTGGRYCTYSGLILVADQGV